jgi:hypothetical protein
VFTIAVVTVLALATAAGALRFVITFQGMTRDQLRSVCAAAGGTIAEPNATTTVCFFPNGGFVSCTGDSCVGMVPRKLQLQPLVNEVRAAGVSDVKVVSDKSKKWVQTAPTNVSDAVGVMRDGACSSLGGEFITSPEGTSGMCQTPTAIVFCENKKNTCSGFADAKKDAAATRKQVKASLKTSSTTTPGGSTTTSGSTTTTGATTTTRATTPSTRG